VYSPLANHPYKITTIKSAIDLSNENNMSFWDSLIAATMIENNIFNIYTENVKDFKISGINAVNPFAKS
jgi:predicted nucleic acid-binding protein